MAQALALNDLNPCIGCFERSDDAAFHAIPSLKDPTMSLLPLDGRDILSALERLRAT